MSLHTVLAGLVSESHLLCIEVTGPFSSLCGLSSEEAGAGLCAGGGTVSLEILPLLAVAND